MNPVQRPRDEHGSSEHRPQNPHAQDSSAAGSPGGGPAPAAGDRDRPQYGIRLEPDSRNPTRSAQTRGPGAPGSTSSDADRTPSRAHRTMPPATGAAGPEDRAAVARAARRMGRGLSFTLIMLGLLTGLALVAMDMWFGWVVGAALAVLGVLGYVLVQTRALPVLRGPDVPERRSWSKLWLIPAALLVPGLACVGVAFVVPSWLGPSVPPELLDDYVLAFIVGGMTMIVGAGLGFGLVATARFTRPDDDDSPLRPTDYAQRLRERDRAEGPPHYDSDWIRRDPRA